MNIFNFFSELKSKCKLPENLTTPYNIVSIGGQVVYVEGHKGLITLSSEKISCNLKHGVLQITGQNMFVKEMTPNTLLVQGKIYKFEVF